MLDGRPKFEFTKGEIAVILRLLQRVGSMISLLLLAYCAYLLVGYVSGGATADWWARFGEAVYLSALSWVVRSTIAVIRSVIADHD